MGTHKTLHDTLGTRVWNLVKGILLYGSVNWKRASDGLKPPKLTPHERKIAMPPKNLEVIRPRENPQAALIKTLPKKTLPSKVLDITAGAIVSEPPLFADGLASPVQPKRYHVPPPPEPELIESQEAAANELDQTVVVHRRRRHHRHGLQAKRAPRSSVQYGSGGKPGLLARWFGAR